MKDIETLKNLIEQKDLKEAVYAVGNNEGFPNKIKKAVDDANKYLRNELHIDYDPIYKIDAGDFQ